MGHLVNARSFRLGWNLIWPDVWYKPHYDYASFIFLCARQRAILRMLFYSKTMDKSPYIFSHFEIEKFCKHLFVKIFFYFIPFEGLMERLYNGVWRTMRRWKRKHFTYPKSHLNKVFKSDSYRNWWNKRRLTEEYKKILRRKALNLAVNVIKAKKNLSPVDAEYFCNKLYNLVDDSPAWSKDTKYLSLSKGKLDYNLISHYNNKVVDMVSKIIPQSNYHLYPKLEKQQRAGCIWLYFEQGHTDISILRKVGLDLNSKLTYGNWLLNFLLRILNQRERRLDYIIDGVKSQDNKFSVTSLEFLDAILERFYDTMRLTRVQRNVRKFNVTVKDLILSVIFALKCQRIVFKVWHTNPGNWRKKLDRKSKSYIDTMYYDNWKGFKFEKRMVHFRNSLYLKKIAYSVSKTLGLKKSAMKFNKNLNKVFIKKYPKYYRFKNYYNKLFCFLFACGLATSSYHKRTLYDMKYFRILSYAFRYRKFNLLYKFFNLRANMKVSLCLDLICANFLYYHYF